MMKFIVIERKDISGLEGKRFIIKIPANIEKGHLEGILKMVDDVINTVVDKAEGDIEYHYGRSKE